MFVKAARLGACMASKFFACYKVFFSIRLWTAIVPRVRDANVDPKAKDMI